MKKVGRSMTLTSTLQISPAVYRSLPLSEVSNHIDWFNVMSYDMYGLSAGSVGFNTPICGVYNLYTVDGAINRIIARGVSPDKLVLGLAGYGYKYAETNGLYKPFNRKNKGTKSVSFGDIQKHFISNETYKKGWSDRSYVPYLQNKSAQIFISYDDADSIKDKVQLAAAKRMNGVMLWALSYDDKQHTLVNVMSEEVGKPMFLAG